MSKDRHTQPAELRLDGGDNFGLEHKQYIDGLASGITVYASTKEEALESALLVIKAVNSHEELVNALKLLMTNSLNIGEEHWEIAREALSKAE